MSQTKSAPPSWHLRSSTIRLNGVFGAPSTYPLLNRSRGAKHLASGEQLHLELTNIIYARGVFDNFGCMISSSLTPKFTQLGCRRWTLRGILGIVYLVVRTAPG